MNATAERAPPTPCRVGEVQPLPDGLTGTTCDWGSCNARASAARYAGAAIGWLPVCATCATKPGMDS